MREYSTKPTPANSDRQRDRERQAREQQLARPAHVAQQHEQQRRTGCRRTRCSPRPWRGRRSRAACSAYSAIEPRAAAIRGPRGRAAHAGGSRPRRGLCGRGSPSQQRVNRQRTRPRRHDQVERDQQVHGPPVGGDRQPERQREESRAAGSASGRRRISSASASDRPTSAPISAAAITPGLGQLASRARARPTALIHPPRSSAHQREAPRREHRAVLPAQAHAHAVFAGGRESAR